MTYEQIQSLKIVSEHLSASGCGYCEVSSLSEPGTTHRVYVSNKLYSVKCDCKGAQRGYDCGHRVAVDRHLDSRREAREELRFNPWHGSNRDAERTAYLNYELSIGA